MLHKVTNLSISRKNRKQIISIPIWLRRQSLLLALVIVLALAGNLTQATSIHADAPSQLSLGRFYTP